MDENMNNIPQNPETAGDQNQNTDGKNQQPEKKGFFEKAHGAFISFQQTSAGKVICKVCRVARNGAAVYGVYKIFEGIANSKKQQEVIAIEAPAQEEQETPVEEPAAEQADEVVNE